MMNDAKCYDFDRNRYPAENMFVGEIENGCRYPYGTYRKEEINEKIAVIESEIADIKEEIGEDIKTKLDGKADKSYVDVELEGIRTDVDVKFASYKSKIDEKIGKFEEKTSEEFSEFKASVSEDLKEVDSRLSNLEYVKPEILELSATPSLCEKGASVKVTVSWKINKEADVYINGFKVEGESYEFSNVTRDQTYTLYIRDGYTEVSQNVSVHFANQIYFGALSDFSKISELSKTLSDEKSRTFTATASAEQYVVYAIPKRLGNVKLSVNGIVGGFEEIENREIENENEYREMYRVYKSVQKGLKTVAIKVEEA